MTHRLATLLLVVAAAWTVVSCSSATPPGLCNLTIVALPADSTLEPGDPLPAESVVLAAPNDFDRTATEFVVIDGAGTTGVNLTLQGDATARVAAHTAGHTGEFMAIALNGTVVAVPMIQGPLLDGTIQITGAGGADGIAQRFAGCLP